MRRVHRDGFFILLLPLIRDISMHEVRAFARISAYEKGFNGSLEDDENAGDVYDVRFEVIRDDSSNEENTSTVSSTPTSPAASPRRSYTDSNDRLDRVSDDSAAPKQVVDSKGVWKSSLTSLLSPISSFWPLSSQLATADTTTPGDPEKVEANTEAVETTSSSVNSRDGDVVNNIGSNQATQALLEAQMMITQSPSGDASLTTTKPTVVESVVTPKPKGAPPAGRISERLAALRASKK